MNLEKPQLLLASLKNQYLLEKAACKTVTSELCGLQAQFANNPRYALRIRGSDFDEGNWNYGLVKTWTFRGTLHAVLREELGLFLSARGIPEDWQDGWRLEGGRMEYWSGFLLEQIANGVRGREALKAKCRQKGMPADELKKVFHGWGGLIYEMSRRDLIAYDCVTAKRFVLCGDVDRMERDEARAVFIRRYFKAFGPATIEDCAYFTAWKKREILDVIEKFGIGLHSLFCEGAEYYYTGSLYVNRDIPGCLFLAGFDQLIMGYKDRSRLMDEKDKPHVTTNTGIVHPTILLDGHVRAKWKKDGERLIVTPFAKITKKNQKRIMVSGGRLFGDIVKEVCFQE